jgi:hypothetical protein
MDISCLLQQHTNTITLYVTTQLFDLSDGALKPEILHFGGRVAIEGQL